MKQWLSTLIGLVLGLVCLYLTLRSVDLQSLKQAMGQLKAWQHLLAGILCFATLGARGWRWWYLLPLPRKAGEMWKVQRALAIGYLVTNVASRLGEVARIGFFVKDSKRSLGEVTGTVVLDRILLDFVFFALLLAVSLQLFHAQLVVILPSAEPFLWLFFSGTLGVLLALAALAIRPKWFLSLLRWLRVDRLPLVGGKILELTGQLANGLVMLHSPLRVSKAWLLNLFSWGMPMLYMGLVFHFFGLQLNLAQLVLMFTLGTVGVVIPSPGGLGTYHYIVSQGLIQVLAVDANLAAAVAVYAHGVNFLAVGVAGIVAYFAKVKV